MRAAHHRDALAYARFLYWFYSRAHKGGLDEIVLVERLHGFRAEHDMFRGIELRHHFRCGAKWRD